MCLLAALIRDVDCKCCTANTFLCVNHKDLMQSIYIPYYLLFLTVSERFANEGEYNIPIPALEYLTNYLAWQTVWEEVQMLQGSVQLEELRQLEWNLVQGNLVLNYLNPI